jgi:hypothetical protein
MLCAHRVELKQERSQWRSFTNRLINILPLKMRGISLDLLNRYRHKLHKEVPTQWSWLGWMICYFVIWLLSWIDIQSISCNICSSLKI